MICPAYSAYKDSGIEWLGDVPVEWDVLPIKRRFGIVGGSTPKSGVESLWDGDVLWATPSDLSKLDSLFLRDTQRTISEAGLESCGTSLVPAGTIILSTRAPIGSLAVTECEICTNQGCKSLIPCDGANSQFFAYLLWVSSDELNIRGKGTTFLELSADELGAFKVPVPSLEEQTAIASFLNCETSKIDALVAEQRRLIELLKEKRQAVISHAVTKGLNPNAPMKPSGIQWLGDVPEHWEVGRLNHLVNTRKGVAFKADHFSDEGVDVVKASDIKELTLRTPSTFLPAEFVSEYPKAVLHTNELVLSTVGSTPEVRNSAVGQLGRVPPELSGSLLNQNTVVFSPCEVMLTNNYLYYLIQTTGYRDHLDLYAHGTANQASLNVSDMLHIRIPLPDRTEQLAIANHLDLNMSLIDDLSAEAERAIELLQERRTALISAAVTGKIDVRDFAH